LRNIQDKLGMTFQKQISRSGFGFTHDGSVDSLVRFLQDSLELQSDFETANVIAFLLCLNGSDLPQGTLTDRERPIGLLSLDAHAAVGKQATVTENVRGRFLREAYSIVQPALSRVDLIAKGYKDGVARGWLYDRATRMFLSDRRNETIAPVDLEALATAENPLTFTMVARNTGRRLGLDRDEDGFPDRTEIDANSDPANAKSAPILVTTISEAAGVVEFSWSSLAGKKYRIEFKNALDGSGWLDAGVEIVAAGAVTTARVNHSQEGPQRFYRVRDVE
jgi:hypothetical protein